ncbi:MAG: leucine--tRNA ligase [Chloroflexi bacterium]|nr:leucine--tRNA ligase [Chloroflexota bacterium]MYK62559.1 leucine--tRNA ligase [Chloroflexota bacterium]
MALASDIPPDTSHHLGDRYDHGEIEPRIRELWDGADIYRWNPDDTTRPKWFVQSMFPYPSGDLHIGHWFAFSGGDAAARFKRMEGYNVLHPQGFDAFGLPAENAAIRGNVHPSVWTYDNIANMRNQFDLMGNSYDWSRQIITCDPEYYKWNQHFFLKFLENGLAYRSDGAVNWCPEDQTTLANEQVKDGKCERCETTVIKRNMPQWYFAITKYADEMLDMSGIDWPEKVLVSQENWIGRSEGVDIRFDISEYDLETTSIPTFTTRIDTIFGVTFVVLAPEHPLVDELTQPEYQATVEKYVAAAARETEIERTSAVREKTGVPTGSFCLNPLNGERVPILVGDYVLATYGTGAVMGVPAHDERDFEFAKKYNLPIRVVVAPKGWDGHDLDAAYIAPGVQVNSGEFDGLPSEQGKESISDAIEANGWGERVVTYHLRDWLISRQRYWGTPIPIIYCDDCGAVPVPYEDLPVELPSDAKFQPSGRSPLIEHEEFLNAPCPNCDRSGKRETDTMDTFMDSSWYHMRYLSPEDATHPFDRKVANGWAPVDQYTGGMEHAVMHLLYARFFNRAMRDMGYVDFSEPYVHLFSHGTLTTETGKISKRSNPLAPDPLVREYGADTLRCYLMFLGPWDRGGAWTESGINGIRRWLHRVWDIGTRDASELNGGDQADERELDVASHTLTKRVIEDMRAYKYNTSIAALMTYVNQMNDAWENGGVTPELWRSSVQRLLLHLAPLAPHIAEELWLRNGWAFSIHEQTLPEWDEAKLTVDTIKIVVQVNGRVRDTITVPTDAGDKEIAAAALSSPGAVRHTQDKQIHREIYVPGRLFNIVVG